jgi:hypothetical protein
MNIIQNPVTQNTDVIIYEDEINKVLECHFFTADEDIIKRYKLITKQIRDEDYLGWEIEYEDHHDITAEESEFGPEVKLYVEPEPVAKVD